VTTPYPLRTALDSIQKKMLIDFEGVTREINHKGLRGREREAMIVARYLEQYLPAQVRPVHGAEIVDSEGSRSPECDIVVQDIGTPPLHQGDATAIIPVEWAHGVIEAKSTLSLGELRDSQGKIARVKGLKKLKYAQYPSDIELSIVAYGQRFTHFPMWGAVFAYSGSPLPNLAKELRRLQAGLPMDRWVDMVIVLDAGLLLYRRRSDGIVLFRPEPDSVLCAVGSGNALMPATLAIQDAFGGVWMPQAKLGAYLGPEAWGEILSVEE
jgi:hypothetical protein